MHQGLHFIAWYFSQKIGYYSSVRDLRHFFLSCFSCSPLAVPSDSFLYIDILEDFRFAPLTFSMLSLSFSPISLSTCGREVRWARKAGKAAAHTHAVAAFLATKRLERHLKIDNFKPLKRLYFVFELSICQKMTLTCNSIFLVFRISIVSHLCETRQLIHCPGHIGHNLRLKNLKQGRRNVILTG